MKLAVALALLAIGLMSSPLSASAQCDVTVRSTDTYLDLTQKLECLRAEIEDLRKAIAPAQRAQRPQAPVLASDIQESDGIRFEVERCARSGGTIECRVHITSLDKDQHVHMSSDGIAVDMGGVTYRWHGFQSVGDRAIETGGNRRWYVAGVRVAATIVYRAQSDVEASGLAALQVSFAPDGRAFRMVTFRNLALQ
ncbi:MAG: hypothetical protein ACFCUN_00435 [Hyphomicrobiaceae bacterium]